MNSRPYQSSGFLSGSFTMSQTASKTNALLILFPGYNTLDVNGPFEVFRKSGTTNDRFVTVASETEITVSTEGAQMRVELLPLLTIPSSLLQCDVPLNDDLIASLDQYDLLIIPGGAARDPNSGVQAVAKDIHGPFMRLIQAFYELPSTSPQYPRILLYDSVIMRVQTAYRFSALSVLVQSSLPF
jgi:hypothetical protein